MGLSSRQKLANVLRHVHLLTVADFCCFLLSYLRSRKATRQFLELKPDALIPPPFILYDILGGVDLWGFYSTGKEHAEQYAAIISKHRSGPLRILEWGCGPARVLQHLSPPDGQSWQLCGSDYNAHSINWCKENLPGVEWFHNRLDPPIPAPTGSFDVVYCNSVFTHLSEPMHFEWINEIFRLLKPGGLFIGTFHGQNYRDDLTLEEQKRFDAGQLVVRDKTKEGGKNFSAYHGDGFVYVLLAPFARLWQEPSTSFRQTVWCAEKQG